MASADPPTQNSNFGGRSPNSLHIPTYQQPSASQLLAEMDEQIEIEEDDGPPNLLLMTGMSSTMIEPVAVVTDTSFSSQSIIPQPQPSLVVTETTQTNATNSEQTTHSCTKQAHGPLPLPLPDSGEELLGFESIPTPSPPPPQSQQQRTNVSESTHEQPPHVVEEMIYNEIQQTPNDSHMDQDGDQVMTDAPIRPLEVSTSTATIAPTSTPDQSDGLSLSLSLSLQATHSSQFLGVPTTTAPHPSLSVSVSMPTDPQTTTVNETDVNLSQSLPHHSISFPPASATVASPYDSIPMSICEVSPLLLIPIEHELEPVHPLSQPQPATSTAASLLDADENELMQPSEPEEDPELEEQLADELTELEYAERFQQPVEPPIESPIEEVIEILSPDSSPIESPPPKPNSPQPVVDTESTTKVEPTTNSELDVSSPVRPLQKTLAPITAPPSGSLDIIAQIRARRNTLPASLPHSRADLPATPPSPPTLPLPIPRIRSPQSILSTSAERLRCLASFRPPRSVRFNLPSNHTNEDVGGPIDNRHKSRTKPAHLMSLKKRRLIAEFDQTYPEDEHLTEPEVVTIIQSTEANSNIDVHLSTSTSREIDRIGTLSESQDALTSFENDESPLSLHLSQSEPAPPSLPKIEAPNLRVRPVRTNAILIASDSYESIESFEQEIQIRVDPPSSLPSTTTSQVHDVISLVSPSLSQLEDLGGAASQVFDEPYIEPFMMPDFTKQEQKETKSEPTQSSATTSAAAAASVSSVTHVTPLPLISMKSQPSVRQDSQRRVKQEKTKVHSPPITPLRSPPLVLPSPSPETSLHDLTSTPPSLEPVDDDSIQSFAPPDILTQAVRELQAKKEAKREIKKGHGSNTTKDESAAVTATSSPTISKNKSSSTLPSKRSRPVKDVKHVDKDGTVKIELAAIGIDNRIPDVLDGQLMEDIEECEEEEKSSTDFKKKKRTKSGAEPSKSKKRARVKDESKEKEEGSETKKQRTKPSPPVDSKQTSLNGFFTKLPPTNHSTNVHLRPAITIENDQLPTIASTKRTYASDPATQLIDQARLKLESKQPQPESKEHETIDLVEESPPNESQQIEVNHIASSQSVRRSASDPIHSQSSTRTGVTHHATPLPTNKKKNLAQRSRPPPTAAIKPISPHTPTITTTRPLINIISNEPTSVQADETTPDEQWESQVF